MILASFSAPVLRRVLVPTVNICRDGVREAMCKPLNVRLL